MVKGMWFCLSLELVVLEDVGILFLLSDSVTPALPWGPSRAGWLLLSLAVESSLLPMSDLFWASLGGRMENSWWRKTKRMYVCLLTEPC